MDDLNNEWLNFINNGNSLNIQNNNNDNHIGDIPKSNDLYISTQTKICYLNTLYTY